jgi:hypothetical protein
MAKKEFISEVTGEVWSKEFPGRWNKVIHHTGVTREDFSNATKNGGTVTLTKGSEVFIDDIRGRIKPQYRVKDSSGKIWFVPVGLLEILETEESTQEISSETHSYKGGVRSDAQQINAKN